MREIRNHRGKGEMEMGRILIINVGMIGGLSADGLQIDTDEVLNALPPELLGHTDVCMPGSAEFVTILVVKGLLPKFTIPKNGAALVYVKTVTAEEWLALQDEPIQPPLPEMADGSPYGGNVSLFGERPIDIQGASRSRGDDNWVLMSEDGRSEEEREGDPRGE